ncbi:MAG: hypothetical protein IJG30_04605, partial [Synergistaceae bacterium]|nr:hypothetical protein [Synergistaceae bacterium]
MVNHEINRLVKFAVYHGLISASDSVWAANSLIGILGINKFEFEESESESSETFTASPDSILSKILDWSAENKLIENTETERDLLDTELMGVLTPRPSDVISKFEELRADSPVKATDYFYNL